MLVQATVVMSKWLAGLVSRVGMQKVVDFGKCMAMTFKHTFSQEKAETKGDLQDQRFEHTGKM